MIEQIRLTNEEFRKIEFQNPGLLGKFLREELGSEQKGNYFYYLKQEDLSKFNSFMIEKQNSLKDSTEKENLLGLDILSWIVSLKVANSKQSSTVLYTGPSSDVPKGRISETFLELLSLHTLSSENYNQIRSMKSSKKRFVKTITTNHNDSIEPFYSKRTKKFFSKPLIVSKVETPDKSTKRSYLSIPYYLPSFLLEDFQVERKASLRSRLDKNDLFEFGLITEDFELSEIAKIMINALESWMKRELLIQKGIDFLPKEWELSLSEYLDVSLSKSSPIGIEFLIEQLNEENEELFQVKLSNILNDLGYSKWRIVDGYLDVYESSNPWIALDNPFDIFEYLEVSFFNLLIDGHFSQVLKEINETYLAQGLKLITGELGEGKSVLLAQLSLYYLSLGIPIFAIHPERELPEKWPFIEPVIVIIDNLEKLPSKSIIQISKWLLDPISPQTIFASIRKPILFSFLKENQLLASIEEKWAVIHIPEWTKDLLLEMLDRLGLAIGGLDENLKQELLVYGDYNPTCITAPIKSIIKEKKEKISNEDLEYPPAPYILKINRLLADIFVDKDGYFKNEEARINFDCLNAIGHLRKPLVTREFIEEIISEFGGDPKKEMVSTILKPVKDYRSVLSFTNNWWRICFVKSMNEIQTHEIPINETLINIPMAVAINAHQSNRFSLFEAKKFVGIANEISLMGTDYSMNNYYPVVAKAAKKILQKSKPNHEIWGVLIMALQGLPLDTKNKKVILFQDLYPEGSWTKEGIDNWITELPFKQRSFIFGCLADILRTSYEIPYLTDFAMETAYYMSKYLSQTKKEDIIGSIGIKFNYAYMLAHKNDFEKSNEVLNEIVNNTSIRKYQVSDLVIRSILLLGSNKKDQKQYNDARKYYDWALQETMKNKKELEDQGFYNEVSGQVYFRLGFLAFMEKDYQKAESILEQAIRLFDLCNYISVDFYQTISTLAKVKFLLNKKDQSKVLLQRAIPLAEKVNNSPELLNLYELSQKIQKSEETEKGTQNNEEKSMLKSKIDSIITEMQTVKKFNPNIDQLEKDLLEYEIKIRDKDVPRAINIVKHLLTFDNLPLNVEFFLLGESRILYSIQNRFEESKDTYRKIIDLARKNNEKRIEMDFSIEYGGLLEHLKEEQEAINVYDSILPILEFNSPQKAQELKDHINQLKEK